MGIHYTGSPQEEQVLDTWIKMARSIHSVAFQIKSSFEDAGLTETQFGLMEILLHLGPQQQKSLAEKHLVSGGNITMVVNNLERDGLVQREVDPNDKRAHLVHLTPAGRKLISDVFRAHLSELMNAFECLDSAEINQLGTLCKKLGTRCGLNSGDER